MEKLLTRYALTVLLAIPKMVTIIEKLQFRVWNNNMNDYSILLMSTVLIGLILFFLKENGVFWGIKHSFDLRKWKKTDPERYKKEIDNDDLFSNISFGIVGGTKIIDMNKFLQRPGVQAQIRAAQKCAELEAQGVKIDYSKCEIGPFVEFENKGKK